jgi:predicted DNA-binding transcriptional regulator AlpA
MVGYTKFPMAQDSTGEQPQRLLTEREVAEILTVSIGSIRRWRMLNTGPRFYKIGGSAVRYKHEDVMSWMEDQPQGGTIFTT